VTPLRIYAMLGTYTACLAALVIVGRLASGERVKPLRAVYMLLSCALWPVVWYTVASVVARQLKRDLDG
jgi:hypothetical protein